MAVTVRPRRLSTLGEDIKGDTSAPAVSTMNTTPSQREASRVRRRALSRRRSTVRKFFTWYREISYRHTWVNPLVAILIGVFGYAYNPTDENPFSAALFLSYKSAPDPNHSKQPDAPQYGKGLRDIAFVLYYTFFFSFTREFLMQRVLRPFAHRSGIFKKAKVARFMEQSYTAIYFAFLAPYGMYVMYHTDIWFFNTKSFYENYPHKTHTSDFKAYYLLQAAYWLQQAIVLLLQLEKPRKDFKELILHHIVTISLIGLSYRFHFTWIGIAVFWTHDVSDFFLATSKTLNYMDHPLVAPWFALFIGMWIYMRHYLFLVTYSSVFTEFKTLGPWVLDWENGSYKSGLAQLVAIVLLGSLQAMNLFWLFLILRIAVRFAVSKEAVDERSEDEPDEEEDSSSNQGDKQENTPRIEITAPENGFNLPDSPAAQLHKEELKKEL